MLLQPARTTTLSKRSVPNEPEAGESSAVDNLPFDISTEEAARETAIALAGM